MFATLTAAAAIGLQSFDPGAPNVTYTQVGNRQNIGINNPEQITLADLGDTDSGNFVIYRDTLTAGDYRMWFSHVNRTGVTIGYAVEVVNTGTTVAQVRSFGRGHVGNIQGGQAFRDMFLDTSAPITTTLNPGQRFWMWRINNAAIQNSFFNGAIDFSVLSGQVQFDTLAFRNWNRITGNRNYMGYITRVEPDGTRESRVYKGRAPVSTVELNRMDWSLFDVLPPGPLPVTSQDYNLNTQQFLAPVRRNQWFSNIGPSQNAQSSTRDMVAWLMPGWGWIDPLRISDADNRYPNLGNWGIEYVIRGQFTNRGRRARLVGLSLQAPSNGGSPIAYRGMDGVWRSTRIEAGQAFEHTALLVPGRGGQVNYEFRYILGGPGAGSLRNTAYIKQ